MINKKERLERIKSKGFSMPTSDNREDTYAIIKDNGYIDYSKIKVGAKILKDAVIDVGDYKKIHPRFSDKCFVLQAINRMDYDAMRQISDFYYKTSGIYKRLCTYLAYMYKYDWMIVPYVSDEDYDNKKLIKNFHQALNYCDNFELKSFFGETALKVIRYGCYYGYLIETNEGAQVQELPPRYCRSRYTVRGKAAIEFDMKFFNDFYPDEITRMKILNLFPEEFQKGYSLYRRGKLIPEYQGDDSGWYLLDLDCAFKFNLNGEDYPAFISTIPAIIDLDNAQGLDRKKLEQQLLKIIIQKMPIDKNGDLVFDVDEAQALHNNAVGMIGDRAVGVKVLTTFADVDVADMADNNASASDDTMDRIKSAIFDQGGTSQLNFNANSNIALTNSILNDEAFIYPLILQFQSFINKGLLKKFNKSSKKVTFKGQILSTTIYNYKDLAKLYKEQTQLGYSKFLPQIALGQSQSAILASAKFENDVLDLVNLFIPPLMSSTMSSDFLTQRKSNSDGEGAGRKELDDTEKSDKTIQNRESLGQG